MITFLTFTVILSSVYGSIVSLSPSTIGGIRQAIQDATSPTTLILDPGIYTGWRNCDLRINGSLLLTSSEGPDRTIIDCQLQSRCITIYGGSSVRVNITGITFLNGKASSQITKRIQHSSSHRPLPRRRTESSLVFSAVISVKLRYVMDIAGRWEESVKITKKRKRRRANKTAVATKLRGGTSSFLLPPALVTQDLGGCVLIGDKATANLANVVVKGCVAAQGSGIGGYGAASVSVVNSTISSNGISFLSANTMDLRGGGAYFLDCTAIAFGNSRFSSNYFTMEGGSGSMSGAGLCVRASSPSIPSSLTLTDTVITGNKMISNGAGQMRGAGLFLFNNAFVTMINIDCNSNSIIGSQNTKLLGGGMYLLVTVNVVTFSNISITNNTMVNPKPAVQVAAAGLFFSLARGAWIISSSLTIMNNTLLASTSDNVAIGAGASITNMPSIIFNGGRILISHNSLTQLGDGGTVGGGVLFSSCNYVVFAKVEYMEIAFNSMVNLGQSMALGAGFMVDSGSVFQIGSTQINVSANSLQSTGSLSIMGAGILIQNCPNATIVSTTATVSENLLISNLPPKLRDTAGYSNTETNATNHCSLVNAVITSTNGFLSDGSFKNYSNNMHCIWTVDSQNDAFSKVFGKLIVSFARFDLEDSTGCINDYVSLYDGTTTQAPLIGQYCGRGMTAPSRCSNGKCPPLNSTFTTSAAVTVLFHSDPAIQGDGFLLKWTLDKNSGFAGGSAGLVPDQSQAPASVGAGIAVVASTLMIAIADQMLIAKNTALHPIHASGGGAAASSAATLMFSGSGSYRIENNTVVAGGVANGGGIAASDHGTVLWIGSKGQMVGNSAIGNGGCFVSTVDGKIRCSAGIGGAVSVSTSGIMTMVSSNLVITNNVVNCQGPSCVVQGGAIALVQGGNSLLVSGISCALNVAQCIASNGCNLVAGGCVYQDDGWMLVDGSVIVQGNIAMGIGGGGGIATQQSAALFIKSSSIADNTAVEGGGMWLGGASNVFVNNTIFNNNSALSVAGAIAATQDANLMFHNSICSNNSAKSRASAILTFNDNNKGYYELFNISFEIKDPGNAIIMLGRANFTSAASAICEYQGTVFEEDFALGTFYSLTCAVCGIGTYAAEPACVSRVPLRTCLECPIGAICRGSTRDSNGLTALQGYWGAIDSKGVATMYQCPPGYCCAKDNCEYNYCQGNRQGVLCGQCPKGSGLAFFTENCVPSSLCTQSSFAYPLLILGTLSFVLFLLKSTANRQKQQTQNSSASTGHASVLLFFFQVLGLIKNSPWKSPSIVQFLAVTDSISNMSPSGGYGSASTEGICLYPEMVPAQKMSTRLLFQGFVTLLFIGVYVLHWCGYTILLFRSPSDTDREKHKAKRPCKKLYLAAFSRFLTIAFTSMLLVPLQMVQCDYVEGKLVWIWDASVKCYQGWQVGAIFMVSVLGIVPLCTMFLLWRKWKDPTTLDPSFREIREVIRNGFREKRRWYMGVTLYRRFLIVMSYAVISDKNWRSITITTLCVLSLLIHLLLKPFGNRAANVGESVSLTILTILSASSMAQMAQVQYGSSVAMSGASALEVLQFMLVLTPVVGFVGATAYSTWMTRKENNQKARVTVSEENNDDDDKHHKAWEDIQEEDKWEQAIIRSKISNTTDFEAYC